MTDFIRISEMKSLPVILLISHQSTTKDMVFQEMIPKLFTMHETENDEVKKHGENLKLKTALNVFKLLWLAGWKNGYFHICSCAAKTLENFFKAYLKIQRDWVFSHKGLQCAFYSVIQMIYSKDGERNGWKGRNNF